MTIGQLAKLSNVNIDTIRYYEKLKLLPKPKRSKNGYREYNNDYNIKINYILRAKALGFTLREVKEIFNTNECEDLFELTSEKIKDVESRISNLNNLNKKLKFLLKKCPVTGSIDNCSIMKSILKTQS
ncbi:MAG: MerR family DNA-binding transcriptional regulator [Ignavibacteria bacterium]